MARSDSGCKVGGGATTASLRKCGGVTQGDPVYPIIFNIVVDEVVQDKMMEVCIP